MTDSSKLDLGHMRVALEEEKAALVALTESTAGDSGPVALDQQSVGRLSRMDAMQVQAMAKAVGGRRAVRIKLIEAALGRLEEGEYGFCLECGEEIAIKRLQLDPAASHCVDCQT